MSDYENRQQQPVRPQQNFDVISPYVLQPVDGDCPNGGASGGTCPYGPSGGGEEPDAQEEFGTQVRKGPPEPTDQERDQHESTGHAIFRSWCGPCVQGRGRAHGHFSQDHRSDATAVVSWDYGFLGSKDGSTKQEQERFDRDAEA